MSGDSYLHGRPSSDGKAKDALSGKKSGKPVVAGKLTTWLGQGADGQNSIAIISIAACLILGFVLSVILIIEDRWGCSSAPLPALEDAKGIWSVFTPIISLALGYVFGRRAR